MSTEHSGTTGGPGVLQLYAINKTDPDAWVLGALVKTFRSTNQTAFVPDAARNWTITPANEEDSAAFVTAMELGLPPTQASTVMATRTRESGTIKGGGTAGGVDYAALVGGPVGNEGSDADRKLTIAVVNWDPTSGGWTQVAGAMSNKTLVFKTVKNSGTLTVGFAIIDAIPDEEGDAVLYEKASGSLVLDENLGLHEFHVTKYTP